MLIFKDGLFLCCSTLYLIWMNISQQPWISLSCLNHLISWRSLTCPCMCTMARNILLDVFSLHQRELSPAFIHSFLAVTHSSNLLFHQMICCFWNLYWMDLYVQHSHLNLWFQINITHNFSWRKGMCSEDNFPITTGVLTISKSQKVDMLNWKWITHDTLYTWDIVMRSSWKCNLHSMIMSD